MTPAAFPCNCGFADISDTIQMCACHIYWIHGTPRTSVTSVIRSTWPIPKNFKEADPAVIENARHRGSETDALFSAYINGTLREIPAGTRLDVYDPNQPHAGLLQKLMKWWDKQGIRARTQVMLHDDAIAGTADIVPPGAVWDLKCTHNLEASYEAQLGAYGHLALNVMAGNDVRRRGQFFKMPDLAIIHVTARFPEPRLVEIDAERAIDDWLALRRVFKIGQRR